MKIIFAFIFIFITIANNHNLLAQNNTYTYYLDLLHSKNNTVQVQLITPTIKSEVVVFHYVANNLTTTTTDNLFINTFNPTDSKGKKLPFEVLNNHEIKIFYANKLNNISYSVTNSNNKLYQAGNPKIIDNKCYVISASGYYGYFLEYENLPFVINFKKQNNFYGATALPLNTINDTITETKPLTLTNLLQNAILFAPPDTAHFKINNVNFNVAVYSETNKVKAFQTYYMLQPAANAVAQFINSFPVSDYNFILYFDKKEEGESIFHQNYGALTQNNFSMYVFPEINNKEKLKHIVQRIVTHELLHLLVPYQLQSNKANMYRSQTSEFTEHLWFFEGMIDYFALICLLNSNLISETDFFNEIARRINLINNTVPISLTQLSKNVYKNPQPQLYSALYTKGSVIAFFLDINIQQCTKSKSNLLGTVKLLIQQQQGVPFQDESLFTHLINLTCNNLEPFFNAYVKGKNKLPYNTYLAALGMKYYPKYTNNIATFGEFIILADNKTKQLYFNEVKKNYLKINNLDVLVEVNGIPAQYANLEYCKKILLTPQQNQTIQLQIKRNNKIINLTAQPEIETIDYQHVIIETEQASSQTKALKNNLLNYFLLK